MRKRVRVYSCPTKSGSVSVSLTVTTTGEYLKSLDWTRNVYCCPVGTLSNKKKPNELVVVVRTTLFESVIEMVALRRPLISDVTALPETVTVFTNGVGDGVGVTVGVGDGEGV